MNIYGVDDSVKLDSKLAGVLAPAAEFLVDIFLSSASNIIPIQPLLQVFTYVPRSYDTSRNALTNSRIESHSFGESV